MTSIYDVFISHSSADKDWVAALATNLKAQGLRVFLDIWELKGGGRLSLDLQKGLERSNAAILIVTPEAARSGWVQEEYDAMMGRRRDEPTFRMIPAILGSTRDFPFLRNILAIRFTDDARYRRSFHELLSALRDEAPGDGSHEGPLQIPGGDRCRPLQDGAPRFLEELFLQIDQDRLSLLLAQEGMLNGAVTEQLLASAQTHFGADRVLHIVPPVVGEGQEEAYFGAVAEQCGACPDGADAESVRRCLNEHLDGGQRLCLILTGFENGTDQARRQLAGVLRGMIDQRAQQLRILIQGGEKLADLRDAQGDLSLLSRAQTRHWPELQHGDVRTLYKQRFNDDLPEAEASTILEVAGGEPRLVRSCMIFRRSHPETAAGEYREELLDGDDEIVWQLVNPLARDDAVVASLQEAVTRRELGRGRGWIINPAHRRLYWRNLLTRRDRRLVWRCDVLREAAQELVT